MQTNSRLSDGVNRVVVAGGAFADAHPGRLYNARTDRWEDLPSMANPIPWCSGWVLNGNTFFLNGLGVDSAKVFYMRFVLDAGTEEVKVEDAWGVLPDMDAAVLRHVRMISL